MFKNVKILRRQCMLLTRCKREKIFHCFFCVKIAIDLHGNEYDRLPLPDAF